jgi:hypothetical protein
MKMFDTQINYRNATIRSGPNAFRSTQGIEPGSYQSFFKLQSSRLTYLLLGLVVLGSSLALAGCGGVVANGKSTTDAPSASSGSFIATPNTVQFGSVNLGSIGTAQVSLVNSSSEAVVITQVSSNSGAFATDGEGSLPVTLGAGQIVLLSVHFSPTLGGNATGVLTLSSNSLLTPSVTIQVGGTGLASSAPALSSLSCSSGSMAGAGTDSCTVALGGAAPSSGVAVALSSNNAAVTVPATVTVPAGATTVGFTANVAAVSSAQKATITSSANGVNQTFAVELSPQVASGTGGPTLTINASSVTFGNVAVGTPSTQSITLASTGSAAVTVSGVTLSGTGFTDSGVTFPLTLNSGKSATLSLQFEPKTTGAVTGQLTVNSNSSTNGKAVIPLSGTGVPLEVALSWDAPSGSTVSGYNIYRATGSSSSFAKLNPSVNAAASYTDTSAQAGATYEYYVTSLSSSGMESAPSNTATVNVP